MSAVIEAITAAFPTIAFVISAYIVGHIVGSIGVIENILGRGKK